jgi:hypothetical protein
MSNRNDDMDEDTKRAIAESIKLQEQKENFQMQGLVHFLSKHIYNNVLL